MKYIIFTDLDGTLLDHDSYSFKEAKEALRLLQHKGIALVINTSKTKGEVLCLREELENSNAFIVENGAGVFFPKSVHHPRLEDFGDFHALVLGIKRQEILKITDPLQEKFGFTRFSDMSLVEVATVTGLSLEDARNAKQRDFTEPFILEDRTKLPQLETELPETIAITEGGRFFHFISKAQDKGKALLETQKIYEDLSQEKCISVALGDGKNDHSMLEVANKAVLIPKPDGSYENLDIKDAIHAPFPGPKGWNEVIKRLIE